MAWNEPGGNNNDKDPWTGKPKSANPPDLEAVLRNLRNKLTQLLNKKSGSSGNNETPPTAKIGGIGVGTLGILILIMWLFWGIFIVGPAEQAVILRFGKYVTTVGSGPHWIPRLIETSYPVNEQRISTYSYSAEMLTKDQNIVSVAVAVQYRVGNARDYLFNVVNPQESLQQATASALRQVIGRTNLDEVLTSGREQIRHLVQTQITNTLEKYQTGLIITDVAMQPAKAPDEVKEAFDDAIKAQEDEQRFENQAQAYAMQVVPIAKGQAKRLLADANAYQQQVVLHARGEITPFLAILPEYLKAPGVTRERLYLETLQSVLNANSKVLLDTNSNNMTYLPLDKLTQVGASNAALPATIAAPAATTTTPPPAASTDQSSTSTTTNTSPQLPGGYE